MKMPREKSGEKLWRELLHVLKPELDAQWLHTQKAKKEEIKNNLKIIKNNNNKNKNKKAKEEEKKKIQITEKENKKIVLKIPTSGHHRSDQEEEIGVEEPSMPPRMRRIIEQSMMTMINNNNGGNPTWVVEKKLTSSDVRPNLSRLLIPTNPKLEGMLREEEKETMTVDTVSTDTQKKGKLTVKVVDGEGGLWDFDFKLWKSMKKFVFTNQWKKFVQKFELEKGHSVQIWCFRNRDSKLCFAINVNKN